MPDDYTIAEIVRWLERLDASVQELLLEQRQERKDQMRWVWGILAAIVIFGLTTLLRGSL